MFTNKTVVLLYLYWAVNKNKTDRLVIRVSREIHVKIMIEPLYYFIFFYVRIRYIHTYNTDRVRKYMYKRKRIYNI